MRAFLKIAALVALVLLVVLGWMIWTLFGRNRPMVDREIIGSGMSLVIDGYAQVFMLYAGRGTVVLIDAGPDPEAREILAELERRELAREAVTAILITHAHADHIAGAVQFPNATIMAMLAEQDLIEGRGDFRSPLSRFLPGKRPVLKVTQTLGSKTEIRVNDLEIRSFGIPGHTPGSAAYLVNGVLYLGDSAVARRDGTLAGAPWIVSDDVEENRASLVSLAKKLRDEDVKAIAFGHSGPLQGIAPLREFASRESATAAPPAERTDPY